MDIRESTIKYEAWLRKELAGELVEKDLERKHDKMKESAFVFLRATYWRWAEIIFELCPELSNAPCVLAVGDIHIENFGTWRDVDGRLIWGINDFDDAAEMPFTVDLVRLAASAFLARNDKRALAPICTAILDGYSRGLRAPKPFVLDRDHPRMRKIFVASEKERVDFWKKIDADSNAGERHPGQRYLNALLAAMPDADVKMNVKARTGGTGSLGRPRWVALAEWKGGPVVSEARAVVPSAWVLVPGRSIDKIAIMEIPQGRYRAPIPGITLQGKCDRPASVSQRAEDRVGERRGDTLGRRDAEGDGPRTGKRSPRNRDRSAVIEQDLNDRADRWLVRATEKAADATKQEFKQWKKG
jgi:hypothetical protein